MRSLCVSLYLATACWYARTVLGDVVYWENREVAGDVVVPAGEKLVLRGNNVIGGQLVIAEGGEVAVDDASDMSLVVGNIDIAGTFRIGRPEAPYTKKAVVELACDSSFIPTNERRKGVVVRAQGTLALFGAKGAASTAWTFLNDTAEAGSTCLNIDIPDNWSVGDEIVISTTDFDPHQSEKRVIRAIQPGCVAVDEPLKYMHYGYVTEDVDERSEVGLLSRNIVFRGCQEQGELSIVGGHLMILEHFRQVQVQGVEFHNFGQGDQLGRYALHFHLAGRVPADTFLKYNAIHDSNFRAVTLHGTQGVTVEGNVAYNITGHAVMLEDGAESDNTVHDNLIVLVREKLTDVKLGSDAQVALSAFYITNANNSFVGNRVAGVEGTGFWIHTRLNVRGLSYATGKYNEIRPFKVPIREMRDNLVHSSEIGFKIESPNLDAADYPQQTYSPHVTYMPDEMPVLKDFVVHHCRQGGWFRSFRLTLDNWTVGDVTEGVQILTTGVTPDQPAETYIQNSRFVGGTSNRGNLVETRWQYVNYLENRSDSAIDRADGLRMGIMLYDGPTYISNCTFTRWYSQKCLNYINPAIGTRLFNTFVMSTENAVVNSTFEHTDYSFYISDRTADGGKSTSFRDTDGSISNLIRSTMLPDFQYFFTPICTRSKQYGLACPHRYANIDIVSLDTSQDPTHFGLMKIIRNNVPTLTDSPPSLSFDGQYIPSANGWLYHPIVSAGASYTIHFPHRTPNDLRMTLSNAVAYDNFTVAIVYPVETQLDSIVDKDGADLVAMAGRDDNNCTSCYFFDEAQGLLHLRLQQTSDRASLDSACPFGGCVSITIHATVPDSAGLPDLAATGVLPELLIDGENDHWLNPFSDPETSLAESADNIDWCDIGDPCLNGMDAGNRRMGILAYQEDPCIGVGCYSPTCRYCKLTFSSATMPFPICPYDPNYVPTDNTTQSCSQYASVGDDEAGVRVIEEPGCASGGLGCINTECRFCMVFETTKSSTFLNCSNFDTASPAPSSTDGQTEVPVVPTQSPELPPSEPTSSAAPEVPNLETEAPSTSGPMSTESPVPSSSEPTSTTTPEVPIPGSEAPSSATQSPSNEPTPSAMPEAPTSTPPVLTTDEPSTTPSGSVDQETPYPSSPAQGASGSSDQSIPEEPASTSPAQSTEPPVATEAPSLSPIDLPPSPEPSSTSLSPTTTDPSTSSSLPPSLEPDAATIPPSTVAPSSSSDGHEEGCLSLVPEGDYAAGISAINDKLCAIGGLGCFTHSCRFCKSVETSESRHLLPCSVDAIRQTYVVTETPVNKSDSCWQLASPGDLAVGLITVTDASCKNGGLGCLSASCRFCRTRETTESAPYMPCEGVAASQQVDTTDNSPVASTVPDPCRGLVSSGDLGIGITALSDTSCSSGGRGCVSDVCRYCKTRQTPQSAHLLNCTELLTTASRMLTSIDNEHGVSASSLKAEVIVPSVDMCSHNVSLDENVAGIFAFTDYSCARHTKEGGCFTDKCRYCRTPDAVDVLEDGDIDFDDLLLCPHYVISSSMGGNPIQDTAALECAMSVSFGDSERGVSAILDNSCSHGHSGRGCFAREPCRYCKYRETRWSAMFEPCRMVASSDFNSTTRCEEVIELLGFTNTSVFHEPRCGAASVAMKGCISFTSCRVCKLVNDTSNDHLPSCAWLDASSGSSSSKDDTSVITPQKAVTKSMARLTEKQGSRGGAIIFVGPLCIGCLVAIFATVQRYRGTRHLSTVITPHSIPRPDDGRRASIVRLSSDADFSII
ncbi:hypothetical protein Poli38472_000765 [Pythium oligandrum]|uniref:G8 domain-containing protein n=1 Tax=Pythium oligandrum TaxID=41045 RepID=A0A8K1CCY7_PYTOL|nr:hypothetical protein Poli38472_000765 [Pythium oligandrum]|eukprot:TMW60723.1 hypothetical protein Poli38472_000765 [Pythium oligandrum]